MSAQSDFMPPDEVAKGIGCDRKSVYLAIKRGQIPAVQVGRRYWVARSTYQKMKNPDEAPQAARVAAPTERPE